MLMNLLHRFFYILPLFFIWSEFYHLKFKDRIYVEFNQRHIGNTTDYIFYITKLVYLLWIIVGLFSGFSYYFMVILLVSSLKFLILLLKSNKFNNIYDIISSVVCISILMYLFIINI